MGKPKSLLKGQELTLDNHHPNTPLVWDEHLHIHKRVTLKNQGKKVAVSGSLYVGKNREVGVTYDKGGNAHGHISDEKEENILREKLRKEVRDALSDPEEASAFIKNLRGKIDELSRGQKDNVAKERMEEAFDNIMDAFGVNPRQKKILKNENDDLFLLYVDTPKPMDYIGYLGFVVKTYNRYYYLDDLFDPAVYYATFLNGKLNVGELTPYATLKYRVKGFRISRKGMFEE